MSEKKYSETVESTAEVIIDEPTDYVSETETVIDSVIIEQVTEPVAEIAEEVIVKGVVADCGKLNVRHEPTSDSKVITTISSGTEVEIIDNGESTDEFYKICTAVGVEGFCMRKFINILE